MSLSLKNVADHVSKVRSPAILTVLPLKGTSITHRFDAGSAADLQRRLTRSFESPFLGASDMLAGQLISTENILGLTPSPILVRKLFNAVAILVYLLCVIISATDYFGERDACLRCSEGYGDEVDRASRLNE